LLCWRKIPDVVAPSHQRPWREPERPVSPTPEPPGFSRGEIQPKEHDQVFAGWDGGLDGFRPFFLDPRNSGIFTTGE